MNPNKEEFIHGEITFKLDKLLKEKNLNRNQLIVSTGLRFETVQKYYNGSITQIDTKVLAKLCEALQCNVEDLIEYKNYQ